MNEQNEKSLKENELPEVVMVKHKRISIIWIIPIIAAGIGLWLIYTAIVGSGIPITITFKDGSNIDSKTLIKYEGVAVGKINLIKLNNTLDGVIVKATLDRSASKLACAGSRFWVVRPKISFSGISGLETLISGSYIGVKPGKGFRTKFFKGLENPPIGDPNEAGLKIIIRADKLGSLHEGAPVYYREVKVGEVENYKLAGNAQTVDIGVNIIKKYAPLVCENTKFWNASGIGMSVSLFGAKVKTESLAAILTGGIAFATPNNQQMGPASKNGAVFQLYDKPEDEWLKWSPNIDLSGKGKQDSNLQQQSSKKLSDRNFTF